MKLKVNSHKRGYAFYLHTPLLYKSIVNIAGSNTRGIAAIVGPPAVAAGQAYTITNNYSGFTKCTINLSITDMKLYLCRGHLTKMFIPRNRTLTYYMKQFSPVLAQITATSSTRITDSLISECRMTHIIIAFLNNKTDYKYSPTDFSSGFTIAGDTETKNTTDPLSLIKNVRITFANNTYPQEQFLLTNDAVNTNDQSRAFTDYTLACDALRSQSGSLMNFSQWQNNQMYVYKLKHSLNNTSGNVSVLVELTATPATTSNCFILGLYDEYFTMKFDELTQCVYGSLSPSPPIEE